MGKTVWVNHSIISNYANSWSLRCSFQDILLRYCTEFYVLGLASNIWLIFAPGIYPPQVKVFELRELSLKFERHLVSEIINFQVIYQIGHSENLPLFMLLIYVRLYLF